MPRSALAGILIFFSLALAGCPAKGPYHDAVVIEHDAKTVVAAFQQGEIKEYNEGRVSVAEHQKLEGGVEKVALAGQTLTAALQQGATQTTVLADLAILTQAVSDLGQNGVLGVKNEQSRNALTAALSGIKAVLANLSAMLGAPTTTTLTGATKP